MSYSLIERGHTHFTVNLPICLEYIILTKEFIICINDDSCLDIHNGWYFNDFKYFNLKDGWSCIFKIRSRGSWVMISHSNKQTDTQRFFYIFTKITFVFRKKDVQSSLALVDMFGCVWVAGINKYIQW